MSEKHIQIVVGLFMMVGISCITYIAIMVGNINIMGGNNYQLVAKFTSASGLRSGAFIEAAGVRVGLVDSIDFDPEDYLAVVTLSIDKNVPIQEDAIASIRTAGIIGDKFVKITPGALEPLEPGMEIIETEPSINLEELISKYIFESGDD